MRLSWSWVISTIMGKFNWQSLFQCSIAVDQNYEKAVEYYKLVVSNSKSVDLRGHALLNLGMMHHFGLGTPVDLDMAQIYYDKAMKEDTKSPASNSYMTPVYLLNLYSKWQRLDILETLSKFFLFRRPNATSDAFGL